MSTELTEWIHSEMQIVADSTTTKDGKLKISWPYEVATNADYITEMLLMFQKPYKAKATVCYDADLENELYSHPLATLDDLFLQIHLIGHILNDGLPVLDEDHEINIALIELSCYLFAAMVIRHYYAIDHLSAAMVIWIVSCYMGSVEMYKQKYPNKSFQDLGHEHVHRAELCFHLLLKNNIKNLH